MLFDLECTVFQNPVLITLESRYARFLHGLTKCISKICMLRFRKLNYNRLRIQRVEVMNNEARCRTGRPEILSGDEMSSQKQTRRLTLLLI